MNTLFSQSFSIQDPAALARRLHVPPSRPQVKMLSRLRFLVRWILGPVRLELPGLEGTLGLGLLATAQSQGTEVGGGLVMDLLMGGAVMEALAVPLRSLQLAADLRLGENRILIPGEDLPISAQVDLWRSLGGPSIGVGCSPEGQLTPLQSLSALAVRGCGTGAHRCGSCPLARCPYRSSRTSRGREAVISSPASPSE
ncbi:hypothetical protein Taci_0494 [Thermanaerovibrio acidaminovorans DSM 6589]|uniref:Uncharacterized protein n=1 Tax=Thermanaerovibrio acidaminovorans (strain ATCC 49978 / DSM 6589 / Su883) TaxID=525903 RepID=D1B8X7_THEAS|nr:hypothetical protein Taci_0494 [Thermanaerovibrio acidaminovorans DSM 6589]